jgi:hypothetical protein
MVWWGMTEKRELLGLQDLLASQENLEPRGQRDPLVMMDNREEMEALVLLVLLEQEDQQDYQVQ